MVDMDYFKDIFAWMYKRFCWGYDFIAKGIAIFNFVGIFAILLGPLVRSYVFVPILMFVGSLGCLFLGWLMFDKLKFKTRFTTQEGNRDEYFHNKLTPVQQKTLLLFLDSFESQEKRDELRCKVKGGYL